MTINQLPRNLNTKGNKEGMDITPDFAALADQWLQAARDMAASRASNPRDLLQHEAWGRLLIKHGWLTPDGTRATGSGTIATPAEVLPIWREEYDA
jgi:hypothetical protein